MVGHRFNHDILKGGTRETILLSLPIIVIANIYIIFASSYSATAVAWSQSLAHDGIAQTALLKSRLISVTNVLPGTCLTKRPIHSMMNTTLYRSFVFSAFKTITFMIKAIAWTLYPANQFHAWIPTTAAFHPVVPTTLIPITWLALDLGIFCQ